MSELKEFIVTLKNREDLESFYDDLETEGGDLYIPDRKIECKLRRSISRNTHYLLSEDEASLIRHDPRVSSVETPPETQFIKPTPLYTQTEDFWNKSNVNSSSHKNWGLLRCVEGNQRTDWGSDEIANQSGAISVTLQGKNVDIVVVDGMIDPSHPEFAVNSDGTGGSRVVQYNWFQHTTSVTGGVAGSYVYTPYVGANNGRTSDNNHGAHVAGTLAGNTQGWARSANIYNINPYGSDINGLNTALVIDYIREFHRTKPINPVTGRKNPTICNHSWGYSYSIPISWFTGMWFKNQYIAGPFTESTLNSYGIRTFNDSGTIRAIIPARVSSIDSDIEDAIQDGIIMVGAAANDSAKIDIPGGADFDNLIIFNPPGESSSGAWFHEGASPGSADKVICVGAIGSTSNETKATFSNCGPRIDIYAPGRFINSSVNSGAVADPRNSSYRLEKYSGTSMASPQVCGVLACALEKYPAMTQQQARDYVINYSKKDQITATQGGYEDYTDLQGSPNRYLFCHRERPVSGRVLPTANYFLRPSVNQVFPRTKIRRKG